MDLGNYVSTSEKLQGKPKLGLPNAGGGPVPADPLTPHTISSDCHWDIPETLDSGFGDVSNKRRLLAKLTLEFQELGLAGQEPAWNFILHLYRRNCRQNTLIPSYSLMTIYDILF
jgi:hypothetical protein